MERFDLIQVEGVVTECLRPSLIQARLPNGHLVLAHLDSVLVEKLSGGALECLPGTVVLLELKAFDLSSGRVLKAGSV
jgi:translation initiation factor IF-1